MGDFELCEGIRIVLVEFSAVAMGGGLGQKGRSGALRVTGVWSMVEALHK